MCEFSNQNRMSEHYLYFLFSYIMLNYAKDLKHVYCLCCFFSLQTRITKNFQNMKYQKHVGLTVVPEI
jgi:hypothetical protein